MACGFHNIYSLVCAYSFCFVFNMLFGDSGYWWIENLYMMVGRLLVNRHDDRGGNPVPTGRAEGLDSDHVPTGGA